MLSSTVRRPTTIDELISSELCARLDRLDVYSRKLFAGKLQGERRSKKRGQSIEFEDYRNYVPGDDLRRIDWNVFARLDRFFVRVFQEEEDLALHIVLDASPSMDAGSGSSGVDASKLLFAQRLAMALGYIGLVNNNRVSAWVFDNQSLRRMPAVRSRRSTSRLAAFLLASLQPIGDETTDAAAPAVSNATGDFTSALRTIAMSRTGKGVLVLLSDFLIPGGYQDGLRYLAGGKGFDTFCLQVLSPGEVDPTRLNSSGLVGDLRLTDAETGRTSEVTVTPDLVQRYRNSLAAYVSGLKAFCTARGMMHLQIESDADLPTLLLDHLRKRGLLR
ncbi:MAG: DUF58 domain-containing protein [Phycisphaeraceae bacterium]|nr:DUF58 domain-containing protein [Phycisphaeraceae bacterium]